MSGAAVVILTRKAETRLADALRNRGATRPGAAVDLSLNRVRDRGALKRLVRKDVIGQTDNRYWLDERAWESLRGGRRVNGVIALIVVALVTAAMIALGVGRETPAPLDPPAPLVADTE